MSNELLSRTANNVRILSAAMPEKAASGHPGGAMGGADFVSVLFAEFLCYDPGDRCWPLRDRFFLDPGHMSPMLYSILCMSGAYTTDELAQFRQWESPTPGHPELDPARGVENTSGPLGMGHAMALGAAIAERFLAARFGEWLAHKTFAYISDGGIQEEISQGVGRLAGHLGLANYIMFYDSNDIQLSHETSACTSEDTAAKYRAWGWSVTTIDGNDINAIRAALSDAVARTDKPTLIIGKTVMGKGAVTAEGESYERQCSTHGMPLSKTGASFEKTIEHLGGDPANPFVVFDDVARFWRNVTDCKGARAQQRRQERQEWADAHPDLAVRLESWLRGDIPSIEYAAIPHKPNSATRSASGGVLAEYARSIDNMIVCSADLSNSDNTNGFLNRTSEIRRGDFAGKFLQIGVSELTMGAIVNGLALHGGVFPVCGTFFVFSDYMKPAVRLAALMGLAVKYVWTHDAFRVGEDGPTHQPVEQEAQIRLLEKMNNLAGRRSILVLRPADSAETTVAWKVALENRGGPTALLLSRQNIPDIPSQTRFSDALAAARGAYVVKTCPGEVDLVLVGNGSEVSLLLDVARELEENDDLAVQVVSAPSEGLFLEQDAAYREMVLPPLVPTVGVTAGLPVALAGLVGPLGEVVGLERFGASAPYAVLDEKFGYTVGAVTGRVREYLSRYRTRLKALAALASGRRS